MSASSIAVDPSGGAAVEARALHDRLKAFMERHVYPAEAEWHAELARNSAAGERWKPLALVESLKRLARREDLWNLWWPHDHGGRLSNAAYAPLCETMGRVHWAPEVFNCSAPDTGNMETLVRYGSEDQKRQWLEPLAEGSIRSCFAMTEPDVASSDATNIRTRIVRADGGYRVDGTKWWSSGAMDPRCRLFIVMGKTDETAPRHAQQSMILVPRDAPGVSVVRPLSLLGYDDAPHGHAEVRFEGTVVPAENLLWGEGRGFEIAQGRLGPGRIHHCMRLVGQAERALELMCDRLRARVAFGKPVAEQSVWHERIAESRIMIDSARLMVLEAARLIDAGGSRAARHTIAMIKVLAPDMACKVIDWAIQAHGAAGVSADFPLAYMYAWNRTLRIADGPDEVHRSAIAKRELSRSRERKG